MRVTLQTTRAIPDLLRQNLTALSRLGIKIDSFEPNIFKVEALAAFLKTDDPAAWLDRLIEELSSLCEKTSSPAKWPTAAPTAAPP
jgi:DNA mismatch repair protein MutL